MSMLHALRQQLLHQLIAVLPEPETSIDEAQVIEAGSFIRLYCALKGIATLK